MPIKNQAHENILNNITRDICDSLENFFGTTPDERMKFLNELLDRVAKELKVRGVHDDQS